jgi:hypothetical protein
LTQEQLNDIQDDWRQLGFFYDRDDATKRWVLVGSRAGLLRFGTVLREYVADARNQILGEHEHYGPYMHLKIMTWHSPGMDRHAIHGSLRDLTRLASIVEDAVAGMEPGESRHIREEYAVGAEYELVLELREDGFDPWSVDPWFSREKDKPALPG